MSQRYRVYAYFYNNKLRINVAILEELKKKATDLI